MCSAICSYSNIHMAASFLASHSPAPSSAIGPVVNDGLVPGEEQAVRAWLVKQGFEPGDLRGVKKASKNLEWWLQRMMQACEELSLIHI